METNFQERGNNLFNRKISILKVLKDFSRLNKLKNSLIFYIGITFNNIFSILNILDYLLNIVIDFSKKSDAQFSFQRKENAFLYFFKNINYFLGLDIFKSSK